MTDRDIDRIDHSVLYTTDMDPTSATYEALGFTLSPRGLRPIHPDPEPTTRQCHLLPLDLSAAIRMPGDHPRQAGRPLPVLRAGEGGQLPVSHRQQGRLLCQGME